MCNTLCVAVGLFACVQVTSFAVERVDRWPCVTVAYIEIFTTKYINTIYGPHHKLIHCAVVFNVIYNCPTIT